MADTQLPTDSWRKKIVTQSFSRFPEKQQSAERDIWIDGVNFGAIEKQVEHEGRLHDRDKKIDLLMKSRRNQNEFIDKAIALLEKVAYRHEGGLLPDRLLYHDIKKFLDGK